MAATTDRIWLLVTHIQLSCRWCNALLLIIYGSAETFLSFRGGRVSFGISLTRQPFNCRSAWWNSGIRGEQTWLTNTLGCTCMSLASQPWPSPNPFGNWRPFAGANWCRFYFWQPLTSPIYWPIHKVKTYEWDRENHSWHHVYPLRPTPSSPCGTQTNENLLSKTSLPRVIDRVQIRRKHSWMDGNL